MWLHSHSHSHAHHDAGAAASPAQRASHRSSSFGASSASYAVPRLRRHISTPARSSAGSAGSAGLAMSWHGAGRAGDALGGASEDEEDEEDEEEMDDELRELLEQAAADPTVQQLNLHGCRLTLEAMDIVSELVHSKKNINTLKMNQVKGLRDSSFSELCDALHGSPHVHSLYLANANLPPNAGSALADLLGDTHHIHTLDLSKNQLGRPFMRMFVNGLATNHGLRVLNLRNNELSTRDCEALLEYLGANKKLTSLDISRNPKVAFEARLKLYRALQARGAALTCDELVLVRLIDELSNKDGPESLSFENASVQFDVAAWKVFTQELKTNTRLQRLSLADCDLKPAMLRNLASALKSNTTLEKLVLTSNIHVRLACKTLVTAIATSNTLRSLGLGSCHLTNEEADAISQTLLVPTSKLQHLDLRDNPMDGAGIVSILKALATCHSLTELNLSNTKLQSRDVHLVASLLLRAEHLQELCMYQTEIDLESRILLADMCSRHPKQLRIEAEKMQTAGVIAGLRRNDIKCRRIALEYAGLGEGTLNTLLQALCNNTTIESADFRGQRFNAEQAELLLTAVKNNTALKSLNLSGVVIDSSVHLKLLRVLQRRGGEGLILAPFALRRVQQINDVCADDPALTVLELNSWEFDKQLAQGLRVNTHLQKLSVDLSLLADSALKEFFNALRINRSLTSLELNLHACSETCAAALGSLIGDNDRISTLRVSLLFDTATHTDLWLLPLQQATWIESLSLNKLVLTIDGARHLLTAMRKMSWLESLSLDFASMPGTELPSIMECLMSLSNLRQLSVEGWALPVESRVQLLELIEGRGGRFHCSNSDAVMLLRDLHLAAPSTTTYLLAHMDFSGVSAAWLAKAIARNTHIEVLDLRECHMEDGEAAAVLTACYGHHMLRELFLDGNDLGPLTLTAAAKCLRHNRRLVRLGLKGSTEQVPQHCDDLARTLEYHPSLIELHLSLTRGPSLKRISELLRWTPWQPHNNQYFEAKFRRFVFMMYCIHMRLRSGDNDRGLKPIPIELIEGIIMQFGKLTRHYSERSLQD